MQSKTCFFAAVIRYAATLALFLTTIAQGVGFRLATFNIGAHLVVPPDGGAAYFDYGIGKPGQPDHDKVRDILARINADVVALQEMHTTDVTGNPNNLDAMAAALGYQYSYVSPTTGAFDTSLRVVFLSHYPFISTTAIGSPAGTKEITRLFPSVKVDIPGTTNDPTILSLHLKSGTSSEERFRRAVEMKRIVGYFTAQGITAEDNFVILGDFNPSSTNKTFTALPTGLPSSFSLGSDITFPVTYSTNPLAYFTSPIPTRLDPRQLNNSKSTYDTTTTIGPTLDLFLVSPAIAGRPLATEVYNSTLDTSNSIGLPKNGSPPDPGTSVTASDHYAVFADLELDLNNPAISTTLSSSTVSEGASSGTVSLNISIPAIRATPITISISSDTPTAAFASPTNLTIPAGETKGVLPINTPRNFITDDTRSITFTATAAGYSPGNGVLQLIDADAPYTFTEPGQTIIENFTTFAGDHDPAPWITSGGTWKGIDDGTATAPGFRSYGAAGDGSLGFLGETTAATATTHFTNDSGKLLTALQITLTAEQWRAVSGGRADSLTADLVVNGISKPLPPITLIPANNLPTGAIAGGTSTAKTMIASGLSIAPGASFDLCFTFTPGTGGGTPSSEVFINEFHYDNSGTDTGEFVEVAVGPGYTGALSDVSLTLYNGGDGANYGTHLLSTFTAGDVTASGHRIFSKLISGIQNGSPDGFAIAVGGVVSQFISYEGNFIATGGPATGMTSTDVGVLQTGSDAAGVASLGLTGNGGTSSDFTWTKFTGLPHTPGQLNSGQTLTAPAQPQGLAIDNLSVTFLTDNDLDGIPDLTDTDDDNDGQTDADEALFGSDPLDANSIYRPSFAISSTTATLTFPTIAGRHYTVESSEDLRTWTPIFQQSGTGSIASRAFDTTPASRLFYHIIVTYE